MQPFQLPSDSWVVLLLNDQPDTSESSQRCGVETVQIIEENLSALLSQMVEEHFVTYEHMLFFVVART